MVQEFYKGVDTCGNEFDSSTAYLYSSFSKDINPFSCEARPSNKENYNTWIWA